VEFGRSVDDWATLLDHKLNRFLLFRMDVDPGLRATRLERGRAGSIPIDIRVAGEEASISVVVMVERPLLFLFLPLLAVSSSA